MVEGKAIYIYKQVNRRDLYVQWGLCCFHILPLGAVSTAVANALF